MFDKKIGILLMATAALHTVVGIVIFYQPMLDMLRAGLFNTVVPPYYDRGLATWFIFFGALLWMLGQLVHWVEKKYGELPHALGWGLLSMGIVGIIFMPDSGFWLVLPQAALILRNKVK